MAKLPVSGNWLDQQTLKIMKEKYESQIDYFYEDLTGPDKDKYEKRNELLKKNIRYIDDILAELTSESKELYKKYGNNYSIFYCKGKLLLKVKGEYFQKKSKVVY